VGDANQDVGITAFSTTTTRVCKVPVMKGLVRVLCRSRAGDRKVDVTAGLLRRFGAIMELSARL
jgi:hypothetical protein